MKLRIKIPASSANLGSGFDCLSLGLNIYNHYEFETHTKEYNFVFVPKNKSIKLENNLLIKAYKVNCQKYSWDEIPFHTHCHLNIPICTGLGSSANSILAGILLSRMVNSQSIEKKQVLKDAMALESHIDNLAGCLYGGFNISSTIKGQIQNFHYPVNQNLNCLILQPYSTVNTEESRKTLPKQYNKADVVNNLANCTLLGVAFSTGDFSLLKYAMKDKLHQPYRLNSNINLENLQKKLDGDSFFGIALSGSGPSLILLCSNISQRILCILDEYFLKKKEDFRLINLKIDNQGVQVES